MPVWLISLFFAVGAAGFIYAKLVRSTGNSDPRQTAIATGVAGLLIYIVLFTLLKFTFNFN